MLSPAQCDIKIQQLDEEIRGLELVRDARHAQIDQRFRERREAKLRKREQLVAEAKRLRNRSVPQDLGPFVLRQLGQFLCADGQWRESPDDAQLLRFAYRGNAQRATTQYHQDTTVRNWREYQEEQEQKRYRRDDLSGKPVEPSIDPTTPAGKAAWEDYERDHAAWERKKFASGVK